MTDRPPDRAGDPESRKVAHAQAALLAMARRLKADLALLKRLRRALVPPLDLDARQEHLEPHNVTTELIGGLEHLGRATLPDLISTLRRLARVTDEELEKDFEKPRTSPR